MQYQVPQFIEVEDKIFGPLTIKQFIYLAGGAALSYILYRFLYFYIAIIAIIPVIAFALALAFYKVNEKPFINVVESAFGYLMSNKLYIWKKVERKPEAKKEEAPINTSLYVPKLSDSKLKDLAWSLDVNEKINLNSNPNNEDSLKRRIGLKF
ncbi:PrgI family protein [Candidatus Nomurabacteria bacterium]|nr:PrgI family protein [Candidatus Nomurabacteria bacterium]